MHFHDEDDSYEDLNLKEENTDWNKEKLVERVHIKYEPNNNLPTHENLITNQIFKEEGNVKSYMNH